MERVRSGHWRSRLRARPRARVALRPTYKLFYALLLSDDCCMTLDTGLREPDDDVGQAVQGPDVQGVDDDAVSRLNLLVQDDAQTQNRNRLVRSAGGGDGHAADREPFNVRETGGDCTRHRKGSRYDHVRRDARPGH